MHVDLWARPWVDKLNRHACCVEALHIVDRLVGICLGDLRVWNMLHKTKGQDSRDNIQNNYVLI